MLYRESPPRAIADFFFELSDGNAADDPVELVVLHREWRAKKSRGEEREGEVGERRTVTACGRRHNEKDISKYC